jgi:hypothetical protein
MAKAKAKPKTKAKPKVEILLYVGLCGERVKEMDVIDYLEAVHEVTKRYPYSNKTVIEVPEIEAETLFNGPVSYFVIYRKLPASRMKNGVRRVTALDIRRAIKEIVDPEEEDQSLPFTISAADCL